MDIEGLLPGAEHQVVVRAASGSVDVNVATPVPPPGAELYRFATISDLHLGSDHFGFFKQMTDRIDDPEPFALRSARSAVEAAVAWGAEHLVIKGDVAHHGRDEDFDQVGELIDGFPDLPVTLLPGNHDVDQEEVGLPDHVGKRRTPYERDVSHLDRPGVRLVMGDTTITGAGTGTLERVGERLLDAAATSDRGVVLLIHQQLQRSDPVRYWPPGIPRREAEGFLDRLASARPDAVVTSGHTHRNRARHHGTVLITEVASTHHWPGVWAGYAVHEGGVRQVVRRIGGRRIIGWHEYSKNATLSVWQRYAQGRLDQRCLTHHWA
jgi:3',5'-cyclic AMP phosphodiesterase CpdA